MLVADAPWHCLGIIQISLTAHSTSLRVISDEEPTWSPHPTKRPPTSSHPKRHHLPARRFPNAPSKNGLPVIRARRLCSPGNYLDSSCMSTDAVASIVHVWMCRWKEEMRKRVRTPTRSRHFRIARGVDQLGGLPSGLCATRYAEQSTDGKRDLETSRASVSPDTFPSWRPGYEAGELRAGWAGGGHHSQ